MNKVGEIVKREKKGERTRQRETGTTGEGMPHAGELEQREPKGVAKNRWLRLFDRNTALCKHESGRVGCDACPVLED